MKFHDIKKTESRYRRFQAHFSEDGEQLEGIVTASEPSERVRCAQDGIGRKLGGQLAAHALCCRLEEAGDQIFVAHAQGKYDLLV